KSFIDREQQRQQIRERLQKIGQGESRFAAMEFYGIAGLGKSRMLDEVKEQCRDPSHLAAQQVEETLRPLDEVKGQSRDLSYHAPHGTGDAPHALDEVKEQCRQQRLPFVTLDFSANNYEDTGPPYCGLFLQICNQLDHHFPVARVSEARMMLLRLTRDESGWRDLFAAFISRLAAILDGQPLVVLLDGTEHCPEALFDWVGREFLSPILAVEGTSLGLFVAGRGPRVVESQWPKALVRATLSVRLDPLDFGFTEEHLGQLPPQGRYRQAAKDVYALSNGHPYSTEALAYWLNTLGIQEEAVGAQRELLARRLYDEVIRRYILAGAAEWVLPFVEVASIPRRFDAGTLEQLVPRYRAQLATNQPPQWYIGRLVDLQQAPLYLVYLGRGRPAYELEPTFRRLLHTALAILSPAEIAAMHREVYDLWQEALADRSPQGASPAAAVLELLYHAGQIAVINGGDGAAAGQAELAKALKEHFNPGRTDDMQELNLLLGLLVQDADLVELLGREALGKLARQTEQFLRPMPSPTALPAARFELSHLVIEHFPPNEYRVSWYKANQVVLPTESVHSARRFSMTDWRGRMEAIGKAAFLSYLPSRAQEFLRDKRDWAIQLSTDWADIPWELLHDGQDFLCLSRPMARKPKLLREAREHVYERGEQLRALVVGNPMGDLAGAEAEAKAVAHLLKEAKVGVDLLVGPHEATANEFVLRLSNERYDLIHYAGHAYFDRAAPHLSGLRFGDGIVLAEELERNLSSRAFVFLCACEAAKAKTTESEVGFRGKFTEGLAIAVLLGGAVGCLGPMWRIDDGVAKEFALAFYEHLLGGEATG
ncbi:MAG: CHAT domain-containing protein, partial [Chloroflexi bacterium]|nr:CHAT domain-containing protein [Chloroflexota bacterium]